MESYVNAPAAIMERHPLSSLPTIRCVGIKQSMLTPTRGDRSHWHATLKVNVALGACLAMPAAVYQEVQETGEDRGTDILLYTRTFDTQTSCSYISRHISNRVE